MERQEPHNQAATEWEKVQSEWTLACLPPEDILALVDERVPEAQAMHAMQHVAFCPLCQEIYRDMTELRLLATQVKTQEATDIQASTLPLPLSPPLLPTEVSTIPSPTPWKSLLDFVRMPFARPVLVGAIFLLGIAVWGGFLTGRRSLTPDLLGASEERAAHRKELASAQKEIADGKRALVAASRKAEEDRETAQRNQRATEAALADLQRKLQGPKPPIRIAMNSDSNAEWARSAGIVRARQEDIDLVRDTGNIVRSVGEASEPSIKLLQPSGTHVLEDRPTFQWQAVKDTVRYEVLIFTMQDVLMKAQSAPSLKHTEWTPEKALPRDCAYKWMVSAYDASGKKNATSGFVTFFVISVEKAKALRMFSAQHLRLGTLYQAAYLLDDAEREYRAIPRGSSDYSRAQQLLHELQALRERK